MFINLIYDLNFKLGQNNSLLSFLNFIYKKHDFKRKKRTNGHSNIPRNPVHPGLLDKGE